MQIKLIDIEWDTDGKNIDLPSEVVVEHFFPDNYLLTEEDLCELVDQVSDKYGWCIFSANYKCS